MLERTHAQNTQTLLSSRIPRDTEHERYHPELEEELKECLFCLRRNEMMFTSGRRFCAATGTYWPGRGSWGCTPS